MKECVVDAFPKSKTEMVIGTISPYEGRVLAHLRVAVPSAEEDGEWVRTRKGVAIDVEDFPEVVKALKKLQGVAATSVIGGRISKNSRQEIRTYLEPFQSNTYCHIRIFNSADDRPTGKGIAVKVELIPALVDLAERMATAIKQRCWEQE